MAVIDELIREEENGSISFGNYELPTKTKKDGFEYNGDSYKIKTFNEITKLERNGMFVYESVPGTVVHEFRANDSKVLTFFDEEGCPIRWAIAIRSALGDKVGYLCGGGGVEGDKSGLIVFAAKMIGRMIDDT